MHENVNFFVLILFLGVILSISQHTGLNDEIEDVGDEYTFDPSDENLSDDADARCTHFSCGETHVLASTNFISPKPESELTSDVENVVFSYPASPYIVQASAFTAEIHVYHLRKRSDCNHLNSKDLLSDP
jgi:hypothetical protein